MYLTQALHRMLQQTPDLVATIDGSRTRTWRESGDRIARLAGALTDLDVRPGDRVAMLALNSDRYHEYLFAVPWADAVITPVNTRWHPLEIAYALTDSGTEVLLVDDTFLPVLSAVRDATPGLRAIVHVGDGPAPDDLLSFEGLVASSDAIPDARRRGDALAGIFYTGGTTGHPKGVMLSHRNLVTSALGSGASGDLFSADGRLLHAAPMFHLADIAAWIIQNTVRGTHVFVPGFEPVAVMQAIEKHGVTAALLVPTMIQMLVDHPEAGATDFSSVRHLLYGSSPISEAVLDRARAAFHKAQLTQAYGMTELSPVATLLGHGDHQDPVRRRSAGRAAPHSTVRVVDDEGNEVPRGTVGEIISAGDHLMLGYWNKPEETAAAIRDGWMHTGDGGYMDEAGFVYVVDRVKDMIVSGGENVYSTEVENALALHPAVAACAVIAVPDEEYGERVHAVVVLAAGLSATHEELREHCRNRIAGYKCPRSTEFVDAMPLSAAGKILKRELRAKFWPAGGRAVS